jgi:CubicO group peptidase (beta-lactamase class C family)
MRERSSPAATLLAAILLAGSARPATAEPVSSPAPPPWAGRLEGAIERCDQCRFPRVRSVLVLRDGQPVYERYWNGADATTLHDTQSAMKSVTALAVGLAVAEGKISSVEAPAFAFLSHLAPFAHDGPLKRAITVEDLLTMSSALDLRRRRHR